MIIGGINHDEDIALAQQAQDAEKRQDEASEREASSLGNNGEDWP